MARDGRGHLAAAVRFDAILGRGALLRAAAGWNQARTGDDADYRHLTAEVQLHQVRRLRRAEIEQRTIGTVADTCSQRGKRGTQPLISVGESLRVDVLYRDCQRHIVDRRLPRHALTNPDQVLDVSELSRIP